jgi:hypothetical protein
VCLSLHTTYLSWRLYLLKLKHNREVARTRVPGGSIFRQSKTKIFLKKVDASFEKGFLSVAENLTTASQ